MNRKCLNCYKYDQERNICKIVDWKSIDDLNLHGECGFYKVNKKPLIKKLFRLWKSKKNMNSFEEIEKIREEYYKKHKICPKCGSKNYTATLLCIPFNCLKSQEYKDTNSIVCMECGYKGKIDDLKPENND